MKTISTLILLASFCSFSSAANEWELQKHDEDNDIKVYTRKGSNGNSALNEFKGVTTIKSNLTAFVALFESKTIPCSWMYSCLESKVIEKPSQFESFTYIVNDAPWPVSSRDMVIHSTINQDPTDLIITVSLNARAEKYALDDDYVRIKFLQGQWQFKPKPNRLVEVSYQVLLDPAGSIPKMLANSMTVDTPYNTLLNLQTVIKQPTLQNAQLKYIKELH